MDVGIFQLLPQPEAVSDREVIEQALWEGDFAEAAGYDSVWLSHLSAGRLLVGVGPGFSAYEFAAFGVPLGERHEGLEEGLEILRDALSQPTLKHSGRHWTIPPVTLTPG